ncbi:hypothetical protein M3649_20425 [Ureibacillus chungkukjangi]|uniref:hypothetical protein n=1 Tax=Ureibacillus chungkukjangi TaxID=1202712 RepID=UPI000D332E24|nr:hypothetical protein [Ureibacillus chungkukjangi]MCM3390456.1 hypothetical protein [Ureibacillus chungkukjangi]
MEDKGNSIFDLILYFLGIILTFSLLYISNKLSIPLIKEINAGKSILDIIFNTKDEIDISVNLLIPLFLLIIGISILLILLWNIFKYIFFGQDTKINKIITGLVSIFLLIILIKALINSWSLIVLTLVCGIISILIIAIVGSLLNNSSGSQKG